VLSQPASHPGSGDHSLIVRSCASLGDRFPTQTQEKFLQDRIKVNGKAGVLGDSVSIARSDSKIVVSASLPFSKRYLKYLTKKYLKKQSLRDYVRVVADSKNKSVYKVTYFKLNDVPEDEE